MFVFSLSILNITYSKLLLILIKYNKAKIKKTEHFLVFRFGGPNGPYFELFLRNIYTKILFFSISHWRAFIL